MVSMGDPFADLSPQTVAEVLAQKGWTGLVHSADELAVNLGALVVVATAGKVGDDMLEKLLGAHGDIPRAPTHTHYAGGEQRTVRFFRRPDGRTFANAVNMHGACAGVSVLTSGRELLPPSMERGIVLRWHKSAHAATTALPDLPEWFIEMARDPAAAARAWGTSRPSKDQVRVLSDWESTLVRARGKPVATFGNLCKILRGCPEFAGRFAVNDMTQSVEFEGRSLPEGRIGAFRERVEDAPWGGFSPAEGTMMQAIRAVAEEHRYHPVRDYLSPLKWDGTPRLEAVAESILHAQPAPLVNETIRRWFISAVARALKPGEKVDTALVLVGAQGLKKSTFFYELAPEWFADTEIRIGDKDAYGQIHAAWITEWAEIDRVTDQYHANQIKAFVARRSDTFRPPYGRTTDAFPRSCIIVGSTNRDQFLNDPTGARRFWCVTCTDVVNIDLLRAWRDQLWAEAVAAYRAGERWWFDGAQEAERAEHVDRHRVSDAWEEIIATWLRNSWPDVRRSRGATYLTSALVLECALKLSPKDMNAAAQKRAGEALASLGLIRDQCRVPKSQLGLYRTPEGKALDRINFWVAPGETGADAEASKPIPAPTTEVPDDAPEFPFTSGGRAASDDDAVPP